MKKSKITEIQISLPEMVAFCCDEIQKDANKDHLTPEQKCAIALELQAAKMQLHDTIILLTTAKGVEH